MTKGGVLVGIKTITCQLAAHYLADGMDEILMVEVFEPVFIGIMGVGPMVELMSGGVLYPIFVMNMLQRPSAHV